MSKGRILVIDDEAGIRRSLSEILRDDGHEVVVAATADEGLELCRASDFDVALLDATFFDANEIPGRSLAEIPHPFVVESMARFGKLAGAERRKVVFTHLNHSNRAALPDTPERAAIVAAGMRVAVEGERIDL